MSQTTKGVGMVTCIYKQAKLCERQWSMQSRRSVQVFPTALLSQWRSVTPLPIARFGLAVVLGPDGRIYVLGGTNSGGNVHTVEVYDPTTQSWTSAPPMPTARFGLAAVLGPDGRIYALGGENDNSEALVTVEAYNLT